MSSSLYQIDGRRSDISAGLLLRPLSSPAAAPNDEDSVRWRISAALLCARKPARRRVRGPPEQLQRPAPVRHSLRSPPHRFPLGPPLDQWQAALSAAGWVGHAGRCQAADPGRDTVSTLGATGAMKPSSPEALLSQAGESPRPRSSPAEPGPAQAVCSMQTNAPW